MNTPGVPADEPGPRVGSADRSEPLLPDSQLGSPWWAPAPELVPAAEGTFRFLFRVTGHDDEGSPVLTATVTTVLRFPPPPAGAQTVPWTDVSVRLRIPFVDADTGRPTSTELPVDVDMRDGVVHCRAEISGAVARAAYGALSTPGFQPDDGAGLVVGTSFVGVQETLAAWATSMVNHDRLDRPLDAGRLEVVPIRAWPFEEPPREEHPIPEEHPNWAEVVTTEVRVPGELTTAGQGAVRLTRVSTPFTESALTESSLTESALAGSALRESALRESSLTESALTETSAAARAAVEASIADAAVAGPALFAASPAEVRVEDVAAPLTLARVPLPLPRAGGRLVLRDDLRGRRGDILTGIGRSGGLATDPPSFTMDMGVSVTRSHRLPLLVPCRDNPGLYRQDVGGPEPVIVGCQDAFQLGRVPARRFAPAPRLDRDHRYSVWESLQQPATYLVVPAHYRVARDVAGRPQLEWLQVFDATVDAGLPCRLQARCVPDLSAAELAELESLLRADAGGRDVRVLLPTSPSVGSTGVSVRSSTLEGGLRAVLDDDAIRLALHVDYDDAVVAVTQLRGGDAVSQVVFDTGDSSTSIATTVHLDVDELAGPYPGGPVRVTATGLRNDADTAATVTALWVRPAVGGWQRVALDPPVRVAAHGDVTLPAAVRDGAVVPQAVLDPADPAQLVVRNVYLENLHTAVLIRRDVDLHAAGVAGVGLVFAVSGIEVARAVLPADAPTLEVTLVQPLVADRSTFDRKVAVSVTLTRDDGTVRPAASGPVVVDLAAGAIVRLSRLMGV
ncbi:hypothetical protein GCM10009530_61350 [Microbispora corallina]|uniref:Uncharacterized protein n=1 Tax=Microbispora corallina TaxID=83302 RepID=A0ABQ4G8B9_9ACTN|nr:hypothetical protein [Microbispora corallina]GIH43321.1 hypothetical protein Mco01_63210 [Microbispora corallina]